MKGGYSALLMCLWVAYFGLFVLFVAVAMSSTAGVITGLVVFILSMIAFTVITMHLHEL